MNASTGLSRPGVAAVVVSYQPEAQPLAALVRALRPQVNWLLLVDNASAAGALPQLGADPGFELHRLDENIGLAAAQNIGIERALALGAAHILLCDQDSLPSPTLVDQLLAAFQDAASRGVSVAAVGPMTVDVRTATPSFFVVEHRGRPRRYRPDGQGRLVPVEVAFLIASGSLIDAGVLQKIGGMRSQYFIDHIDTEWSFRARRAGYRLLGVPAARLQHRLGDSVRNVWFFGWRQVMAHSPLRDYYMFRNTLLMLRDTQMRLWWRLHFLWRLLQFGVYFLGFAGDRWLRCRRMLLGLWHGLKGQGGRLDQSNGACAALPASHLEPDRR